MSARASQVHLSSKLEHRQSKLSRKSMHRDLISSMRSITDQDYDQLLRDVNYELEDIALEKQSKEQKKL
jgi:hypothetical protein